MVRYILDIFEGSYEELKLNNEVICSISRTPIHLTDIGKRKVTIKVDAQNEYICEYDIDITIQPGQEHCVVDALGIEIAKSAIDINFEEFLLFRGEKFHIEKDRNENTISFFNGDEVFGVIKNYPHYHSVIESGNYNEECEIFINETKLKAENQKLFSYIIAAYPSFRISW